MRSSSPSRLQEPQEPNSGFIDFSKVLAALQNSGEFDDLFAGKRNPSSKANPKRDAPKLSARSHRGDNAERKGEPPNGAPPRPGVAFEDPKPGAA